jgi:lysophospholipase L1-like esterase
MLGKTVLLILVLEILLRLVFAVYDQCPGRRKSAALPDRRCAADAYGEAEWVHDYWKEHVAVDVRWEPYVYWRRTEFTGDHVNVTSNGIRRTWNEFPQHDNALNILVFGGSAVWGTGARDNHTIPSLISRQLSESGIHAHVTNLGETGYVSTQEVILLIRLLQHGARPNVVVFYDGVNDTFSAYQQGIAGLPQNEPNREAEFDLLNQLDRLAPKVIFSRFNRLALMRFVNSIRRRLPGKASRPQPPRVNTSPTYSRGSELEQSVVDIYLSNVNIVQSLSKVYAFDALFYWQPTVFAKAELSTYEEDVQAARLELKPFFASVHSVVQSSASKVEHFHDLSTLFADRLPPTYVDWCHLGEQGNQVVAERVTKDILTVLERRDTAGQPDRTRLQ